MKGIRSRGKSAISAIKWHNLPVTFNEVTPPPQSPLFSHCITVFPSHGRGGCLHAVSVGVVVVGGGAPALHTTQSQGLWST